MMLPDIRETLLSDLGSAVGAVAVELLNALDAEARMAISDATAVGATLHVVCDITPLRVRLLMRTSAGETAEVGRIVPTVAH